MLGQPGHQLFAVELGLAHGHILPHLCFGILSQSLSLTVFQGAESIEILSQCLEIFLAEGFGHTGSHGIVEVGHRLAAVHFILVGLDGDTAQSGIALDAGRFPQIAVTGGETVFEQLQQIDLAAGLGEHIEVLVVDVNIAVDVCGGHIPGQDIVVHKIFGSFGAVFQHGSHGGVGVDVGVFPLDVGVGRIGEGQFFIDLHQIGFRLTDLGVFRPIENIGLGGFGITGFDEGLLHQILNLFHSRDLSLGNGAGHPAGQLLQSGKGKGFLPDGHIGFADGLPDFAGIKGHHISAAFADGHRPGPGSGAHPHRQPFGSSHKKPPLHGGSREGILPAPQRRPIKGHRPCSCVPSLYHTIYSDCNRFKLYI